MRDLFYCIGMFTLAWTGGYLTGKGIQPLAVILSLPIGFVFGIFWPRSK